MSTTNTLKVLTRDFPFDINTGTAGTPVWTKVGGVDSLTFNFSKTDADASDFDNAGWARHIVAMRGLTITASGKVDLDPTTKQPTAGQAAVEASAQETGYDAIQQYRVTRPSGDAIVVNASAKCNPFGGGTNDASKWDAEFTVDGAPEFVEAP